MFKVWDLWVQFSRFNCFKNTHQLGQAFHIFLRQCHARPFDHLFQWSQEVIDSFYDITCSSVIRIKLLDEVSNWCHETPRPFDVLFDFFNFLRISVFEVAGYHFRKDIEDAGEPVPDTWIRYRILLNLSWNERNIWQGAKISCSWGCTRWREQHSCHGHSKNDYCVNDKAHFLERTLNTQFPLEVPRGLNN